ncbi:crotonobetaine/carnitine-CoA ligase [Desulfovibrio aminophilus]|uniref:crotonobetaine/carnitine-CoA ligase n=1 Tax=Desulfovibrio aminophilus TaxID=81425 RepID=UPI0033950AE7
MDIVGTGTLRSLWDELAGTYAGKTALIVEDVAGNTCAYSYAELNEEINRAANLLLGLGVKKGDRVAMQLCNSAEQIIAWFGTTKIGAVMVPINTQYVRDECEYIIRKCGARAIITERDFLDVHKAIREDNPQQIRNILVTGMADTPEIPGVLNFNRLLRRQDPRLLPTVPLSSEDTAEILFTSGTTSRPKGAVITHHNLLFAGHYTAWQCSLRSDDRYLTMMPGFHIDFQCTAAMPTFTSGATLIVLEKYSAHKFWNQVCVHRATITECIPLMVRTLMLQPRRAWERNHCLREVYFYLSITDQEKADFEERFNVRLLSSYGMTETLVGLIGDIPGQTRKWPSIGRPGLAYEAKIVDADGREAQPNTVGEILVRGVPGKTLFKEYHNDPEATSRVLDPDGWLRTGDNAFMDESGIFYFVDRGVNMIKRSGENISSTEIENTLACHPKIAEAAVIGVPDAIRDEAVKAFVILKEGETMTPEEVIAYCAERMAKFKVPSFVEMRTSFPRTCTGKIQKKKLKD